MSNQETNWTPLVGLCDASVGRSVTSLCVSFYAARKLLQDTEDALDGALAAAGLLEDLAQLLGDAPGHAVEWLEATPARTVAEARAKVKLGRLLVKEDAITGAAEFLTAAQAELAAFMAPDRLRPVTRF